MAKAAPKLILNPSRDVPFDCLVLSQANVRRVKVGVTIPELAEDIARRSLLQSLAVRPILDEAGVETGRFEVPAGGRRYRALELLVKQKRLAKNALIPCVVKAANDQVSAEEDSFAENTFREQLHPLDQFRAMQAMVDKGEDIEAIAAHFLVTPAVVRQRLKLAAVSPKLHEVYAEDGMTLEQLMAFAVSDDRARQEQVWELLTHSYNKSASYIRQKLTEDTVRVADKRVRFIGTEAYVAAGGCVLRDLFEPDDGGWLADVALLDRLVDAKLRAEGERISAEGWKWAAIAVHMPMSAQDGMREIVSVDVPMTAEEEARLAALEAEGENIEAEWADAPDFPDEINARLVAIDEEIGDLLNRPKTFDPEEIARAGVFVSIDVDGTLNIERGFVRPEDEPQIEVAGTEGEGREDDGEIGADGGEASVSTQRLAAVANVASMAGVDEDDADGEVVKPISDRLVAELTAWRTVALQDAFAQSPSTAFAAVLHGLVLATFYSGTRESCLQIALNKASFGYEPIGLKDSAPARAITERHKRWKERLPQSDKDLWEALLHLDGSEQAALFAHCASQALNAQQEVVSKYDNGRVSKHSIERRIEHSHVLARAVGLDVVGAGWRPTVADYFHSVPKPRILADVTEAKGARFAEMIDHLKKGDMAREAERLLEDAGWLPEVMRTPDLDGNLLAEPMASGEAEGGDAALPAFLDEDGPVEADNDDDEGQAAAA